MAELTADEVEDHVYELLDDLDDKEMTYFGITNVIYLYEFKKELNMCLEPIEHIRTFNIDPRRDSRDVTIELIYIIKKFRHSPVLDCRLQLEGLDVEMLLIWQTISAVWGNSLTKLSIMHENVFYFDIRKFEVLKRFTKLRSLEIGDLLADSLRGLFENLPRQVENLVVHVHALNTTYGPSYDQIVSLVLKHLPRFKTFKLSFAGETSDSAPLKLEKESLEALYEKYATQAETNNLTSMCTIQGLEDENLLGYVRLNHVVDSFMEEAKGLKLDGELSLALDRDYEDEAPSPKKRKCNLQEVHPVDKKFEAIRGYATRKVALKQVYDASVKLMGQDKADSILNRF